MGKLIVALEFKKFTAESLADLTNGVYIDEDGDVVIDMFDEVEEETDG